MRRPAIRSTAYAKAVLAASRQPKKLIIFGNVEMDKMAEADPQQTVDPTESPPAKKGRIQTENRRRDIRWMHTYSRRATMTRMLFSAEQFQTPEKFDVLTSIDKVKYYFNDREPETFVCDVSQREESFPEFIDFLIDNVEGFEFKLMNEEGWQKINSALECLNLTQDRGGSWTSERDEDKYAELLLSEDDDLYVASLELALLDSMKNGDAKRWIEFLVKKILRDHPEIRNIGCESPPANSSINTAYELLSGKSKLVETFFEKPLTTDYESDAGSSQDEMVDIVDETPEISFQKHRYSVPDVVVYVESFPGMFPLIVQAEGLKKSEGTDQNLKQMLNKLHFQDVVFGLMVTPAKYVLSAIIKKENKLLFGKTDIPNQLSKKVGSRFLLNVESILLLHKYVYSVLTWSSKTQCKFD